MRRYDPGIRRGARRRGEGFSSVQHGRRHRAVAHTLRWSWGRTREGPSGALTPSFPSRWLKDESKCSERVHALAQEPGRGHAPAGANLLAQGPPWLVSPWAMPGMTLAPRPALPTRSPGLPPPSFGVWLPCPLPRTGTCCQTL